MSITFEELAERETGVAVVEAEKSAVLAVLETRARAALNMSAEEFLDQLRQGAYDNTDTPAVQRLVAIANLVR